MADVKRSMGRGGWAAWSSRRAVVVLGVSWVVLVGSALAILGPERAWGLWNFNHLTPVFADLRVVTHGAESRAMGFDPMIQNPADPWGRALNYPRIWQTLSPAALNRTHTTGLALGMLGGFLAAVCFVMPRANRRLLGFTAMALFSPAIMLGVERANVDLLMFGLTAGAIAFVRRSSALSVGVLLVGFVLKLFPVFAFPLLMRSERVRFWRNFWWLVGGAGAYLVLNFSDLARVRSITPMDTAASYGCQVWWMEMGAAGGWWAWALVTLTVGVAGLAVRTWVQVSTRGRGGLDVPDGALALDAFRAGAGIYVGTFLVGNNYDYRLMFLIFTLPQLVAWTTDRDETVRRLTGGTLAMLTVSLWDFELERLFDLLPAGGTIHFVVDQLANWGLFFALGYLLARAMPKGIFDQGGRARAEPLN